MEAAVHDFFVAYTVNAVHAIAPHAKRCQLAALFLAPLETLHLPLRMRFTQAVLAKESSRSGDAFFFVKCAELSHICYDAWPDANTPRNKRHHFEVGSQQTERICGSANIPATF